jgi:hypothetical protein
MKFYSVLVFVTCLILGAPVQAQDTDAVTEAQAAAIQWLSLTDSASYASSWESAAGLFKASVSKANWESAVQGVRAPLGAVKSRKLKVATFTKSLPGVPNGEYVIIQFDTQFENKESAIETVTPLKDKDGSWRVSGYFIK